jgi:WD40 repeat protein
MPTRYLLLVTSCLVALTLGSCGSLRLEGGFKQPQELTATARALLPDAARGTNTPPTAPAQTLSPTAGATVATSPAPTRAASARPTAAPTAEPVPSPTAPPTAPAAQPSATAAASHTAEPTPSPSATPWWQPRSPALHFEPQHGISEFCAWSPAGTSLAVADSTGVRVFNPQTLQDEHRLDTGTGVTAVAYSPDGRFLAAATYSNAVQVWDGTGHELLRTIEEPSQSTADPLYMPGEISSLAFSPDGALLAAGIGRNVYYDGGHGCVWVWEAQTGERLAIGRTTGPVQLVRFSPDGTMLASAEVGETYARGGRGLVLWDARTLQALWVLKMMGESPGLYDPLSPEVYDPSEVVCSLAFRRQPGGLMAGVGQTLAEAGRGAGALVAIWNLDTGATRQVPEPPGATCVAYSPNGALLAVGTREGTVRVWDGDGGWLVATLEGHTAALRGSAFSPDGRMLASWDDSGTVRLWERR